MKEIPLHRKGNSWQLYCKINGSINIEFLLDTGCSATSINKEVGDILYLLGHLMESDKVRKVTSSYGGHYTASEDEVNIRILTLGKIKLKNIKATIGSRYGGSMLLGMSFLDALKDYSIKPGKLLIDDGKGDDHVVTNKPKDFKDKKRRMKNDLKRLQAIKESSGEASFKFDYTKDILLINDAIQYCYPYLQDKKYEVVVDILEELYPLLKENIADDETHPTQKGAFITAYFHYYLASAYYGLDKREQANGHYEKARNFFLPGTTILNDIDECVGKLREKEIKEGKKEEPKLVQRFMTTLEEEAAQLGLTEMRITDNLYGNGSSKPVFVGFKDFKSAHAFSVHHHKRLEVIQYIDGVWHRTGKLPSDDLSFYDLNYKDIEQRYFCASLNVKVVKKSNEMISGLGTDNPQLVARIEQNRDKVIHEFEALTRNKIWHSHAIMSKEDLSLLKMVVPGASLQWEDTDLCICALDVEPEITNKLEDDVLAGKFIPCAIGQMPEDFLHLSERCKDLEATSHEDYKGDNNPESTKWVKGMFIVLDDEGMPGYSYRETYDDVHWRWQEGEHSNIGCMKSGEDINSNRDYSYCYWQLVRTPEAKNGNIISPHPY